MQVERRTVGLALAAVASLSSLAAAVAYLVIKKLQNDEEEEELQHKKRAEGEDKSVYTSRQIYIEVNVPVGSVAQVIGREGVTIKRIQQETGAYVCFKDEVDEKSDRICVIRGSVETAPLAEAAIRKILTEQPKIETVELLVPQAACSCIIGKGGNNIRQLQRLSSAIIKLDRYEWVNSPTDSRKVSIRGTSEQIAKARALIEEKVKEAHDIRDKMQLSTANRKPRLKGKQLCIEQVEETEEATTKKQVELLATSSDGFLEVMVSAVANPEHFWVQVCGPKVTELDRLVDQMTDYYNDALNREDNKLTSFTEGDILAAVFPHDKKWYRARVQKVITGEEDYEDDVKVDLDYIDFGDSDIISSKETSQLRPEFLKLEFQAVECYLANVKPIAEEWSEEAYMEFNDLSCCAQWKPVMVRVEGYRARQGNHIPCLSIVNTNQEKDVDIAEEMVKKGFAVWDHGNSSTATSPT